MDTDNISTATETEQIASNEPFLGTLDIILLTVLLGGAVWWYLKKRTKEEVAPIRSYSIQ